MLRGATFASSLLIVVPTLNSHALLPRLLTSLQRQSWPYWRLLFIDGPSCHEHRQWLKLCCEAEPRCNWILQDPAQPGIFGAMNQGFTAAAPYDFLLFWGSDDWAASCRVFEDLIGSIQRAISNGVVPDLVVSRGRYVDSASGTLGRSTIFHQPAILNATTYRLALFLGSTPPHQATLFGPGARYRLNRYASGFYLSADLDYFLQISSQPDLHVQCLDLELVHIANSGVSGQQTQRRLQEVRLAYSRRFGALWWFPFVARYIRRIYSLFQAKKSCSTD
jgi:glycosyltransferase involved in cell wall biosynthesis